MQIANFIISTIITIALPFIMYWIYTKIKGSIEHGYNKQTEMLKGEISKNNALLNSTAQSYFASSERILEKKIEAYDILWKCVIKVKEQFPKEILHIYTLYKDDNIDSPYTFSEVESNNAFANMPKFDNFSETINKILDVWNEIYPFNPYINNNVQKQYLTLQAIIWRITSRFIQDYNSKSIYNWKKDEEVYKILNVSLNDNEVKYIKNNKLGTINSIFNMLEHRIIETIKNELNINHTAEDAVQYVRKMEDLFKSVNKDLKNS